MPFVLFLMLSIKTSQVFLTVSLYFLIEQVKQNTNITVGFVVYDNDLLFQSKAFKSSLGSNKKVISGSLGPTAPQQVNLKFSPMVGDHAPTCLFRFFFFSIKDL